MSFGFEFPRVKAFKRAGLFLLPFLLLVVAGCHEGKWTDAQKDSIAMRKAYHSSPPLSPEESLEHFQLADGFDIKIVASEPLVRAPVAALFDAKGRIWVVEMTGYMPDTAGTGETTNPLGEIVILEDKNHDGIMDNRKVFMDSLILPRAISFYENGILLAEPPNLFFVENDNDKAGARYVVDSGYAVGGNVEHQANGLFRGMDNWIYSANSTRSYRRINGKWVTRRTHLRGQWGISQDKYGRLFYNNNSVNLLGDYFLPGLGAWNPDQRDVSGYNENIVHDNSTFPIRPTPGVNRGYQPATLDDSLRLVNFTAACGPTIYLGGLFGPEWEGNAFVAEPAGNLIKRNILKDEGYQVKGKQAYKGKEFLASDDERFRPNNLYTGPDGALYVVDMYRGIIQDITYLTPYLKNEIVMRQLSDPLNRGRIYKIVPHGVKTALPDLSGLSDKDLVGLLDSSNIWKRLTAQRLLTDRKVTSSEGLLRQKMANDTFLIGKIHAFWTLEGLDLLKDKDIMVFLNSGNPLLQQQGVAAAVSRLDKNNARQWIPVCESLLKNPSELIVPYIGFMAAAIDHVAPPSADGLLLKIAAKYKNDRYTSDAVISGLYNRETDFLKQYEKLNKDTASTFYKRIKKVINRSRQRKMELAKKGKEKFKEGQQLFETFCQACHGADGAGITALGAPLDGSPWVTGDKQRLLGIVLKGLVGPVTVGDKTYRKPEVSGEMPGFGENSQLSDEKLAQILSFVRNSWSNKADEVTVKDVQAARVKYKDRKNAFTQEELK